MYSALITVSVLGKKHNFKHLKNFCSLGKTPKIYKKYFEKKLINYFQLYLQFEKLMIKQSLDYIV
jgi:hypothetical protein